MYYLLSFSSSSFQSQLVDCGEGTDYDFSCVYTVLTAPYTHAAQFIETVSREQLSALCTSWGLLYAQFAALTPLSPGKWS